MEGGPDLGQIGGKPHRGPYTSIRHDLSSLGPHRRTPEPNVSLSAASCLFLQKNGTSFSHSTHFNFFFFLEDTIKSRGNWNRGRCGLGLPQTWAAKGCHTCVRVTPTSVNTGGGTGIHPSAHPERLRCSDGERERARNGRKEMGGEGHPEMPSVPPRGIGGRELVRGLVPSRPWRESRSVVGTPVRPRRPPFSVPMRPRGSREKGAEGSHGDMAPSQGRPQAGHLKWLPWKGSGHFVRLQS